MSGAPVLLVPPLLPLFSPLLVSVASTLGLRWLLSVLSRHPRLVLPPFPLEGLSFLLVCLFYRRLVSLFISCLHGGWSLLLVATAPRVALWLMAPWLCVPPVGGRPRP